MIKLFLLKDKAGHFVSATNGIAKFPQDARVFNSEDEADDWRDENYAKYRHFDPVEMCFTLDDCAKLKDYNPE